MRLAPGSVQAQETREMRDFQGEAIREAGRMTLLKRAEEAGDGPQPLQMMPEGGAALETAMTSGGFLGSSTGR